MRGKTKKQNGLHNRINKVKWLGNNGGGLKRKGNKSHVFIAINQNLSLLELLNVLAFIFATNLAL